MTRRPPTTEIRILLRTILSAGVLAVLLVLACAGTAAGATWVVDDDGGADFTSIQAAVDAAGEGGATRCCERGECPRMWG
ncbi:MAG: hypothetical protein J7J06_06500 [Methanosarcinales archaeon]|nr:hypothetical protein [Methanosarcinales archaeon]